MWALRRGGEEGQRWLCLKRQLEDQRPELLDWCGVGRGLGGMCVGKYNRWMLAERQKRGFCGFCMEGAWALGNP